VRPDPVATAPSTDTYLKTKTPFAQGHSAQAQTASVEFFLAGRPNGAGAGKYSYHRSIASNRPSGAL